VAVTVNIATPEFANKTLPFAVFKFDVSGSLPWTIVKQNGEIDSTYEQGLVLVVANNGN